MDPARLTLRAAGVLLAAFAASCSALDDVADPGRSATTLGIDVSKYQGDIDWEAVRDDGVAFAYVKATEGGDRIDDRFHENWREADEAGVHRGAYHFWYHCRSGREQAAWFIATVPKDPDALPPVLDMEWTPDSPTCRERPEADSLHAEMREWLDAVEAHYGKRPVIYTSVDFYADRMREAFHDHPLWVRSVAGHPSTRYGERRWRLWQFTATGRTDGIGGHVDHNLFAGTAAEFRSFVAGRLSP